MIREATRTRPLHARCSAQGARAVALALVLALPALVSTAAPAAPAVWYEEDFDDDPCLDGWTVEAFGRNAVVACSDEHHASAPRALHVLAPEPPRECYPLPPCEDLHAFAVTPRVPHLAEARDYTVEFRLRVVDFNNGNFRAWDDGRVSLTLEEDELAWRDADGARHRLGALATGRFVRVTVHAHVDEARAAVLVDDSFLTAQAGLRSTTATEGVFLGEREHDWDSFGEARWDDVRVREFTPSPPREVATAYVAAAGECPARVGLPDPPAAAWREATAGVGCVAFRAEDERVARVTLQDALGPGAPATLCTPHCGERNGGRVVPFCGGTTVAVRPGDPVLVFPGARASCSLPSASWGEVRVTFSYS